MDKYKIEKNTVQETLVIPLYGRRLCSRMFPTLFQDESATELMERIDYDFSELEKSNSLIQVFGALEVAMRQSDLTWEVRDYLKMHPKAAVVNLGCGLDNTGRACGNGSCKIYNIDLPDVIELRNRLLPAGPREQNLALDLNEPAWMGAIDVNPADGTVLFAAGVFYLKDVQDRLGHKDMRVTLEIYTHLTEKMQNQSIDILNDISLNGICTPSLMQMGTQTPEDIMNSIELYPESNQQKPSIHAGSEALVPELRVQTCTLPENLGYKMGTKGTILSFESNFESKKRAAR